MRNFIALGIGLCFFSSAIAFVVGASPQVYHSLVFAGKGMQGKERRFSSRMGPYRYQKPRTQKMTPVSQRKYSFSRSSRGYSTASFTKERPLRIYRSRTVKPAFFTETKQFRVMDKSDYTIHVPSRYRLGADGIYRKKGSSLSFRVVRSPEKFECEQQSFAGCATALGNLFRNEQDLTHTSKYVRRSYKDRTRIGSTQKAPIFTESFRGTHFGAKNVYFAFNTVDAEDGSIIRIEAVSSERASKSAAQTMFGVFRSFRF